jgi:hypothetical protein
MGRRIKRHAHLAESVGPHFVKKKREQNMAENAYDKYE